MIRRLAVLVLLFTDAMCGAALAQAVTLDSTPPSRAQVLKLMSAMGVQQSVDASLKNTQSKIKAGGARLVSEEESGCGRGDSEEARRGFRQHAAVQL